MSALQKVQRRLNEAAAKQIVCWIVHGAHEPGQGYKVLSTHDTVDSADIALCAAVDAYFDSNPQAMSHSFDRNPCKVEPEIGSYVSRASFVTIY